MTGPEPIPGPAYYIQTARLVIRCWSPEDAPLLHAAIIQNVEYLRPWMAWAGAEPLDLQARVDLLRNWRSKFDHGRDFGYGIFNPDGSTLLGACGLHTRQGMDVRGIGYWIHKDYINRGFATETSAALTKVAFEVDHVRRVEIHCDVDNLASAAVPRKLGFTHEATLRNRIVDGNGNWHDSMIWSLFAEDYPASPPASAQVEAFDAIGRKII